MLGAVLSIFTHFFPNLTLNNLIEAAIIIFTTQIKKVRFM